MRRAAIIAGVAVVLSLALALHGGPTSEVLGRLAFGWLAYPARVLPKATIARDGVAIGLFCLALFTIGLHRTLRWFYGEDQRAGGAAIEARRPWSARGPGRRMRRTRSLRGKSPTGSSPGGTRRICVIRDLG